MPKLSEMQAPGLPLSGLELVPALQGGGVDGNVTIPLLACGQLPRGNVLKLRAPVLADLSATADADPGAGKLRWNNADPDAATELYINDADNAAADLSAALAALAVGGFIYVQASATSDRRDAWQKWQVTNVTSATGYTKVGVSLQASAGAFQADEVVELTIQQPTPLPGVDRNTVSNLSVSGGNVELDCSLGDYFKLLPTENVTGWTIINVPPACSLMVEFTQDSTARTVAWPASFTWVGGAAGAISSTPGAKDVLAMTTFDSGATWRVTLAKVFS